MTRQHAGLKPAKLATKPPLRTFFAALGLIGLVTGCNTALAQNDKIKSSAPLQAGPALPTRQATPTPLAAQPALAPLPTMTPWPTVTPWPTPTTWPTLAAWQPKLAPLPTLAPPLPTLAPVPVVPTSVVQPENSLPISYAPPDGVDVFGDIVLRWTYSGVLAEDEFFDVRIKPVGSNDSVFVDWSKTPEYTLQTWNGWQAGLYTWQIGIIKGYLEGQTKHFSADTGRASQPFLIKWQSSGGGGGGSGNSSGGS